jgi:hypothetical protein
VNSERSLFRVAIGLTAAAALFGCSGSTEDVRVSFCKNLTAAALPEAQTIEWVSNDNTFRRPEYANTRLGFEIVDGDGRRSTMTAACRFAYDALDDTAEHLANPLSAYSTLPYAMTLNGRALGDGELLQLINAEQKRQGRQILETIEKGARGVAEDLRSSMGG